MIQIKNHKIQVFIWDKQTLILDKLELYAVKFLLHLFFFLDLSKSTQNEQLIQDKPMSMRQYWTEWPEQPLKSEMLSIYPEYISKEKNSEVSRTYYIHGILIKFTTPVEQQILSELSFLVLVGSERKLTHSLVERKKTIEWIKKDWMKLIHISKF